MTAKAIFSRSMELVLVTILSAMVVLVFGNVVARYVFNSAITWAEEVSRFLFVWLTFVGASFGFMKGLHLGMDLVVSKFAPGAQAAIRALNHVIILLFLLVWVVGGMRLIEANWNYMSPATGFSMGLVYMIGPLAAVLMGSQAVVGLVGAVKALRGRE